MLTWAKRLFQRPRSAEQVFTDIFRRNRWQGEASVSGKGSDRAQTERIAAALPGLCAELGVRSLLDIPCGDYHWMRDVDLGDIEYLGADLVRELVASNQRHAREGVSFRRLDLLTDPLPCVDLVLCRDCLVHFSFADVSRALRTIAASGSEWLLTTTFPDRPRNEDIATGRWRPLNLEVGPFHLPPPARLLNEGCTEADGRYADKSLGLWRVREIARWNS